MILRIVFISITYAFSINDVHTFDVSSCPSSEAYALCGSDCAEDYFKCIIDCGDDLLCTGDCVRSEAACRDDCPCGENCLDGCPCSNENANKYCVTVQECQADPDNSYNFDICVEHRQESLNDCFQSCARYDQSCHEECTTKYTESILECPCMSQCGNGCPCDKYECLDKTIYDFSLYVVDSVSWRKEGIFNWNVTQNSMPDEFNFKNFFQDGLADSDGNLPSSRFKCSFSLFGRHHLIGGSSMYGLGNNHFILENDNVQIQSDLDFDFEDGICKGFEESAILCGGYSFSGAGGNYGKQCWIYTDEFEVMSSTQFDHRLGDIAEYENGMVIIAGWDGKGATEYLNSTTAVQNNEWELIDQSEELDNYKNFCAVTIRGSVYTFGNYFGNGEVFKFSSNEWSLHGQTFNYYGQTSVAKGLQVMHIGTFDGTSTRAQHWELQYDDTFTISESETVFDNWYVPYVWFY